MIVFLEPRDRGTIPALLDRLVALGSKAGSRRALESHFAIYGPGTLGSVFPSGTAKRLPAKTRLLFQLHYVTTGVPAVDRTRLGIVFAKEPPRHELRTASAFNDDFTIPPGAPNHEVKGSYEFQDHGAAPVVRAAHAPARQGVPLRAGDPGGERGRCCSTSPASASTGRSGTSWPGRSGWSPGRGSWPRAGSTTAPGNPANPDPTRTVPFGMQSTDEMMIGYFNWIPDTPVTAARASR